MRCARCGREAEELGASINGVPYCHTFDDKYPTCYMLESRKPVTLKRFTLENVFTPEHETYTLYLCEDPPRVVGHS